MNSSAIDLLQMQKPWNNANNFENICALLIDYAQQPDAKHASIIKQIIFRHDGNSQKKTYGIGRTVNFLFFQISEAIKADEWDDLTATIHLIEEKTGKRIASFYGADSPHFKFFNIMDKAHSFLFADDSDPEGDDKNALYNDLHDKRIYFSKIFDEFEIAFIRHLTAEEKLSLKLIITAYIHHRSDAIKLLITKELINLTFPYDERLKVDIITVSFLQKLFLSLQTGWVDENQIRLIKDIITQCIHIDPMCVSRLDSMGNNIFYYLNRYIRAIKSKNNGDQSEIIDSPIPDEISRLIHDTYYNNKSMEILFLIRNFHNDLLPEIINIIIIYFVNLKEIYHTNIIDVRHCNRDQLMDKFAKALDDRKYDLAAWIFHFASDRKTTLEQIHFKCDADNIMHKMLITLKKPVDGAFLLELFDHFRVRNLNDNSNPHWPRYKPRLKLQPGRTDYFLLCSKRHLIHHWEEVECYVKLKFSPDIDLDPRNTIFSMPLCSKKNLSTLGTLAEMDQREFTPDFSIAKYVKRPVLLSALYSCKPDKTYFQELLYAIEYMIMNQEYWVYTYDSEGHGVEYYYRIFKDNLREIDPAINKTYGEICARIELLSTWFNKNCMNPHQQQLRQLDANELLELFCRALSSEHYTAALYFYYFSSNPEKMPTEPDFLNCTGETIFGKIFTLESPVNGMYVLELLNALQKKNMLGSITTIHLLEFCKKREFFSHWHVIASTWMDILRPEPREISFDVDTKSCLPQNFPALINLMEIMEMQRSKKNQPFVIENWIIKTPLQILLKNCMGDHEPACEHYLPILAVINLLLENENWPNEVDSKGNNIAFYFHIFKRGHQHLTTHSEAYLNVCTKIENGLKKKFISSYGLLFFNRENRLRQNFPKDVTDQIMNFTYQLTV